MSSSPVAHHLPVLPVAALRGFAPLAPVRGAVRGLIIGSATQPGTRA